MGINKIPGDMPLYTQMLLNQIQDPIYKLPMAQAVTLLPCKHTFNEKTAQEFMHASRKCPLDGQPIEDYIPNYSTRTMIHNLVETCLQKGKSSLEQGLHQEALEDFQTALNLNPKCEKAQLYLDFILNLGVDVLDVSSKIYSIFHQAIEDNANAQFDLGILYALGKGVLSSDVEAVKWFLKAAAQGHVKACVNLGSMHVKGRGVRKSYEEGAKWFLKAAEKGNPEAQFNMGLLYKVGRGVDKSEELSEEYFLKSAMQGVSKAQNKLSDPMLQLEVLEFKDHTA